LNEKQRRAEKAELTVQAEARKKVQADRLPLAESNMRSR